MFFIAFFWRLLVVSENLAELLAKHCATSVRIWSYSAPHFPSFGLNTGKHGQEKTPYLDTFHTALLVILEKPSKHFDDTTRSSLNNFTFYLTTFVLYDK